MWRVQAMSGLSSAGQSVLGLVELGLPSSVARRAHGWMERRRVLA